MAGKHMAGSESDVAVVELHWRLLKCL